MAINVSVHYNGGLLFNHEEALSLQPMKQQLKIRRGKYKHVLVVLNKMTW